MNKNQVLPKQETSVVLRSLTEKTESRVNELIKSGRLNLPADYSVGNAMSSARLILEQTKDRNGNSVLQSCNQASIANALLEMAILGLNPAKKQCYFIAYGNQLSLFTSVFGKISALKRLDGIDTEPIATIIYEGDKFDLLVDEDGNEVVTNHITSWANKTSEKYQGAYATLKVKGVKKSAVMTMAQIKEAWSKSISNKNHEQFTTEFMKRTVINRLIKYILQTTSDANLLTETLIKNEEQHYDFNSEEAVEEEIKTNANTGEVIGTPYYEEAVEEETASGAREEEEDPYKGFNPKNLE
jgi:recombination protein RecT